MHAESTNPTHDGPSDGPGAAPSPSQEDADLTATAVRDLAALSAVEILGAHAVDLMTAAAVKLGLYTEADEHRDLADARILIDAIAGLIDATAPVIGNAHAAPLRDGLKSLQLAFREQSDYPDAPGSGPGEKYTGALAG